jgi:tetratricopeptide (TPR) repeat protein
MPTIGRISSLLVPAVALAFATFSVSGCHRETVDEYLAAGDSAMQANKLPDAEHQYSEAAKAAPNDPRVHVALGNLYTFEHKPQPAQVEYMKVIDLDPRNPAAHVALGNLYLDQQETRQAEEQYRAAIALDPSHAAYYLLLGDVLSREGRSADAEAQFRTAIGLNPKSAQAHLTLANFLNSQPGRQTEADAELSAARILDPKLAASTAGATEETAPAGAAASVATKIKPLNKVFLLTKNSPVYESPDSSSNVVGQVHKKKYVHVVGLAGDYLQIKLRNGTIGFVPETAAE